MTGSSTRLAERAAKVGASKQPRFQYPKDSGAFYSSVYQWVTKANLQSPVYKADTRKRDEWMQQFWKLEPHLAGVLNSVVSIDQNRNWEMIGGRNQVRQFSAILHDADDGNGWREHAGLAALAYYTSDLGAIVEVGRTNPDPTKAGLAALYSVDSTRCKAIRRHAPNNLSIPTLQYRPRNGDMMEWYSYDYIKLTSMPQVEEAYNGIGYCAVSRVMDLARIMVGVFEHDLEQLRIAPPSGFMTVNGVTDTEFQAALDKRTERRSNDMQAYTSDVVYLVSPDVPVEVKLTALSNLPRDFNLSDFVQTLMLGYALALGYDASEFYSIKYAPLTNAGTATKVQSQKATAKGELSFVLAYQDALSRWLPESILFEFDERSDEGDMLRASIQEVQVRTAMTAYTAGLSNGAAMLPRATMHEILMEVGYVTEEQLRIGLEQEKKDRKEAEKKAQKIQDAAANQNGNDPNAVDNTPADGATVQKPASTDSKVAKKRDIARENTWVRRAAERYPHEPIVLLNSLGRELVLFESGDELLQRHSYPTFSTRSAVIAENEILIGIENE